MTDLTTTRYESLPSAHATQREETELRWPCDASASELPQASAAWQAWRIALLLETEHGSYSLFASFSRALVRAPGTRAALHAHVMDWTIVDVSAQRCLREALFDPTAIERVRRRVASCDDGERHVGRALAELLQSGALPLPNRRMASVPQVPPSGLVLECERGRLWQLRSSEYRLELSDSADRNGCTLALSFASSPLAHVGVTLAEQGPGPDMHFQFAPCCEVSGELTLTGKSVRLTQGTGWYERELAGQTHALSVQQGLEPRPLRTRSHLRLKLDNGCDVSITQVRAVGGQRDTATHALVLHGDGRVTRHWNVALQSVQDWSSTKTFARYPIAWHLCIPALDLTLHISASFPAQEVESIERSNPRWLGRVNATGKLAQRSVCGVGFSEHDALAMTNPEAFFALAGEATQAAVTRLLPLAPALPEACTLAGLDPPSRLLDDVDLAELSRALLAPIRAVTDRTGKAWRGCALLSACEAVGGDSERFRPWLALSELLHVGSLMVDDVQDASLTRRGGAAAHLLFGAPAAINAGNFCYFVPQLFFSTAPLSDADKVRCYDLFFRALRAAHCGQALDIHGLGSLLHATVESGDAAPLRRAVEAVHRLKSGAPVAALGRIGVLLGAGSEAQLSGVGAYFEAIGVAFQIVDDVLNLRGFEGALKVRGEDLAAGKVTMPVAYALSCLDLCARRLLLEGMRACAHDAQRLLEVSARIEDCGALAACEARARELIEDAWAALDPLLRDTHAKLRLRALGYQVLERHY